MRLRLGTRRSALALTQSNWVKMQLEAAHPGLSVELVGMDTQGDEVHGTRFSTEPLQNLDGKNFFVKELDEALLAGKTDLSVHSYKDLSLDRPQELVVAAIPKRENPRDIVLFHPDIQKKLRAGALLNIGSASPRRAQNTPAFLQSVLPRCHSSIAMKPLRGNVTTRLRKLAEGEFDAIILAMAGLNRLGADISAFPKMILPLDVCPTAPAQGALALECRADDIKTRDILAALHHTPTAAHIAREREVLRQYGGGCHQAFGATSLDFAQGRALTFIKGRSDAGQLLDEVNFDMPSYTGRITPWDGTALRSAAKTIRLQHPVVGGENVFIAHHRAAVEGLEGKRLWTSGVMSWQKLAEQGLWVEGCAENLGIAHIADMLGDLDKWTILTHEEGAKGWERGTVIATYKVEHSPQEAEGLSAATHIWWGSGSQFDRLRPLAKGATHHACGAGKTAETLRNHGIEPEIFPSVKLWRKAVHLL